MSAQKNLILLLFCSLTLTTACQKNTGNEIAKKAAAYKGPVVKNDWMILSLGANPDNLNPLLSTDAYSPVVTGYVFDSLVYYDLKTGEPVGRLAKSWTISKNGLTYDFYLRKNAYFHDGKPVTAKDVKFSFDLLKNPKIDAANIQNYYRNLKSTEIVGPYHVRFHLTKLYYRNLINLGTYQIMPEHIYGKGDFNTNPANQHPIGSGPYVFEKWDQGRAISLKRFDKFWGVNDPYWKDKFNFKKILIRIILEDSVSAMALKKGSIDMMPNPTPKQYVTDFAGKDFESRFYRLKFTTADGNGYRYIGWNLREPKFQSRDVRRALAMAMPREKLDQKMYKGLMTLSVGPLPQGSPKLDPSVKPIPYDLKGATALLAKAGWKDTNGDGILDKNGKKFEFELLFTAQNPAIERIALVYQESLKKLGINLKIHTLEWTVFLKQLMSDHFDACLLAWGSSLDSDPYQIWHSSQITKGGSNRIAYRNKRVDYLLEKARRTLDRKKRNKLYQEFSKIIADDAPYLFIFERPNLFITTKRFKNVLPVGKLGPDVDGFFTPPGLEKYK